MHIVCGHLDVTYSPTIETSLETIFEEFGDAEVLLDGAGSYFESIMGIIPAASHTCNSLIRNSSAHTLMAVRHDRCNLVCSEKNVGLVG